PVSTEFEERMRSWWTQAAAEREPSQRADPVEFGIDLRQVRPRFARYVEAASRWTAHQSA
ncbi:sulfotransferase, partial [Mycobacterium sp. ITM-2017-0098]